MPIRKGRDTKGTWYRWGRRGKKYYGRRARIKALRQARAILAHNKSI